MDAKEFWSKVCDLARPEIGSETFSRWFSSLQPISFSDETLTIAADDEFMQHWIIDNYLSILIASATTVNENPVKVEIISKDSDRSSDSNSVKNHTSILKTGSSTSGKSITLNKKCSEVFGTLNPRFSFDEFVVGPSNSFAHAAALAVEKNLGRAYNPLFIYGSTGLGKTHLMQAIGNRLIDPIRTIHVKVAYISAEKLLNEYIGALVDKSISEFRDKYRGLDALLVDDVQFLANKEGLQQEFFHTFNALFEKHKQIVMTCDRPPIEINGLEKRLVSRFDAGLVTEIEKPDFETRYAILREKLLHVPNIVISDEIISFIAENVVSSVRSIEGSLTRIIAFKEQVPDEHLTIDIVRHILRDQLKKENDKTIGCAEIIKAVAEYYNLTIDEIKGTNRSRNIAMPRQIAMYLCRRLTKSSFPEIAEEFKKTHGAVVHACQVIQSIHLEDQKIRHSLRTILKTLGQDLGDLKM